MADKSQKTTDNEAVVSKSFKRRLTIPKLSTEKWLIIVGSIVLLVILTIGIIASKSNDKAPDQSQQSNQNNNEGIVARDGEIKNPQERKEALEKNKPSDKEDPAIRAVYYNDLLYINSALGDWAGVIAAYEAAKKEKLDLAVPYIMSVARAYVNLGNKNEAKSTLEYAKQVVRSQPFSNENGGTNDQIMDINDLAKELGI